MFNPKPREWRFSNKALLDCVEAIKKKVKIDRSYDIPLLAGYSKDGSTLYVDKDMPEGYISRKTKSFVNALHFLLFHEGIEKALIDAYELIYEPPHEVAQCVEHDAVEASGADTKEYNGFMEQWIKHARDKKKYRVPKDLDMTPYVKEKEILKKLGEEK
jgi:hypothetical protein